MYDAVALGELLVDFTSCGLTDAGGKLFEMNPGGAPANVMAALAKFGKKTGFIGKVGDDLFGHHLRQALTQMGVDCSGLVFHRHVRTTLAFVQLEDNGERSFQFYRHPGADQTLSEEDLSYGLLERSKIFHFGSLSLTDEPSRSATVKAVERAKKHGALISFDPNYRPALWKEKEEAVRTIRRMLPQVNLLKLSEEELCLLADTPDPREGTKTLHQAFGIPLIFVTLGEKGSLCRKGDLTVSLPAANVTPVDTTGAGDAFWAAVLYQVLVREGGLVHVSETDLREILMFANRTAAIAVTRRGGIPAMPSLQEVLDFPFEGGIR